MKKIIGFGLVATPSVFAVIFLIYTVFNLGLIIPISIIGLIALGCILCINVGQSLIDSSADDSSKRRE